MRDFGLSPAAVFAPRLVVQFATAFMLATFQRARKPGWLYGAAAIAPVPQPTSKSWTSGPGGTSLVSNRRTMARRPTNHQ